MGVQRHARLLVEGADPHPLCSGEQSDLPFSRGGQGKRGSAKEKGPVLEGPEPGLVSQTASEDIVAEREVAASRQLAQGMSCGSTWISFAKRTSFQSPGLVVKA
ncbi:hypothetical protein ACVW1C_003424 [Bradyrhizobium sp. USDA 4011]